MAVKKELVRQNRVSKWQGSFLIPTLSRKEALGRSTYLRKLLEPYLEGIHFTGAGEEQCRQLLDPKTPIPRTGWKRFLMFMMGRPFDNRLKIAYWRKKGVVPHRLNPDKDRCGLLWVPATIPFQGKELIRVVPILERKLLERGFEPLISFSCLTERCIYVIAAIAYDRDNRREEKNAMQCYRELMQLLHKMGFYSYRVAIPGMPMLPAPRDNSAALHRRLKHSFDPNEILAPGRYDFRSK